MQRKTISARSAIALGEVPGLAPVSASAATAASFRSCTSSSGPPMAMRRASRAPMAPSPMKPSASVMTGSMSCARDQKAERPPSAGITAPVIMRDLVGGEEQRDAGDGFRGTDREGVGIGKEFAAAFQGIFGIGGQVARLRGDGAGGLDRSGADDVGANAGMGVFAGDGARQRDDGAFRRDINMLGVAAAHRAPGTHIDDRATALANHMGNCVTTAQERAEQVELHRALPQAQIDVDHGGVPCRRSRRRN